MSTSPANKPHNETKERDERDGARVTASARTRRRPGFITSTAVFSLVVAGFAIYAPETWGAVTQIALGVPRNALHGIASTGYWFMNGGWDEDWGPELSLNVSSCPGYSLRSVEDTFSGLIARLELTGPPCNAFGTDIQDLTVEVTYESETRLHVHIYDTSSTHFQIPQSVLPRPAHPTKPHVQTSSLAFNYNPSPFEFWITRRSEPNSAPIFDTRASSMPNGGRPFAPVLEYDDGSAVDGTGLVFEDQYLQLTTALPLGTNIYGLGEVLATSGFRRDVGSDSSTVLGDNVQGGGTIQTMWARDVADPVDENIYSAHPFYLEHRIDSYTNKSFSHGVFLLSSAPGDVLLLTPPRSTRSLLQYRFLRGTLDLYFFAGPSPMEVVQQYAEVVGKPAWMPYWGFGFHLCRWGYVNITDLKDQVNKMREANIPLETIWSDIDLYHAYRDFTTDPARYPQDEVKEFIHELTRNNQHYIPIVDAAIPKTVNDTDIYDPYTRGAEQRVFIANSNGSEYVGQVWPGYTVFPDWFAPNTSQWWKEALRNWSQIGVDFSGIWLDMNEVSSFCEGSCGSGKDISDTSTPFLLPGLTEHYPEGDPRDKRPPSPTTPKDIPAHKAYQELFNRVKQEVKEGKRNGKNRYNVNVPPYTIHNGFGVLFEHTIMPDAVHAQGILEIDVHNLWGLMEEQATYLAVLDIIPGKRPFLISRSTFPSSGRWSGHWLGDNFSLWSHMYYSIQGVLQFQLFQIPMVGPDTCGFDGNTNEELCNRWMQLSAFFPFYRNHNILGALPQEPYRWGSVAEASRVAMEVRYRMLPYWYSLFANASMQGTPPVRALFFEFPSEQELFGVDTQFMIGRDVLVTPVLRPGETTVDGIFPGRGSVTWRDWYSHSEVNAISGGNTTLQAPLGHINVHIRSGAALLLHAEPGYTTAETRAGPYELLVSLSADGAAFGWVYIDDGGSQPPGPSKTLRIYAESGVDSNAKGVSIHPQGEFVIEQKLTRIVVLGVGRPKRVAVGGRSISNNQWVYVGPQGKLFVEGLDADLNRALALSWS